MWHEPGKHMPARRAPRRWRDRVRWHGTSTHNANAAVQLCSIVWWRRLFNVNRLYVLKTYTASWGAEMTPWPTEMIAMRGVWPRGVFVTEFCHRSLVEHRTQGERLCFFRPGCAAGEQDQERRPSNDSLSMPAIFSGTRAMLGQQRRQKKRSQRGSQPRRLARDKPACGPDGGAFP